MKREDRFVQSHAPYAVDLESLRVGPSSMPSHCRVDAAWFRRRKGVTVAVIGFLWDFQPGPPGDVRQFLDRHNDGRYGGHALGRWNGEGYWGVEDPKEVRSHLDVLIPMLHDYPAVPPGFDGWWTFR
jgi:hypothetical protein